MDLQWYLLLHRKCFNQFSFQKMKRPVWESELQQAVRMSFTAERKCSSHAGFFDSQEIGVQSFGCTVLLTINSVKLTEYSAYMRS